MKKKLFDIKLYTEGLRQTRLLGIILSFATIGLSALIPLSYYFNYYGLDEAARKGVSQTPINIITMTPILIIFMYIAPFVLCMTQFSFLNKRRASDFYHSIPDTRISIFTSFAAVIFTWITFVIVFSTVISALLYAFCPTTTINLIFIPYTIFTYLAGSVLICAATLLAMSITGTGITNFVLTGLILFFPRFLTIVFSQVSDSIIFVANASTFGILTDESYNIPVGFFKSIFRSANGDAIQKIGPIIYTFILAAVYIIIALLLFQRRKSETAEKSAPNKILQHIYRCLITIPLSLAVPAVILVEGLKNPSTVSALLIISFICLIIYYAYEIITTKNFKNLLKATPVLLFVVAFDVVFALSVLLAKEAVLNVKPSASEIKYVSINVQPENEYYSTYTYNQRLLKNITFEEETLKQIVSDSLKTSIDLAEKGKDEFYRGMGGKKQKRVTIDTKNNGKITRKILFSQSDLEKIEEIQLKSPEYVKAATELPAIANNTNIWIEDIKREDALKVWDMFKKEYEGLKAEDKIIINNAGQNERYIEKMPSGFSLSITVTGYHGFDEYTSHFLITSKTPKAMELAASIINKKNKGNAISVIDSFLNGQGTTINYNIMKQITVQDENRLVNISFNLYDGNYNDIFFKESDIKDILSITKEALNNPVDYENTYTLMINSGSYGNDNVYISLTDEQEKTLKVYQDKFNQNISEAKGNYQQ